MGVMRKGKMALAAVLLLAGFTACTSSNGDGDGDGNPANDYNFNGSWAVSGTVVASNVPTIPVGRALRDTARVVQTATAISLQYPGVPIMTGTCDPAAGTFFVIGGVIPRISQNGTAVDVDTVSGQIVMGYGPLSVTFNYTMQLNARNAANALDEAPTGDSLSNAIAEMAR